MDLDTTEITVRINGQNQEKGVAGRNGTTYVVSFFIKPSYISLLATPLAEHNIHSLFLFVV